MTGGNGLDVRNSCHDFESWHEFHKSGEELISMKDSDTDAITQSDGISIGIKKAPIKSGLLH